ncbi:hypothetical protein C1H21_15315 [Xanthomonas arboricola pv. juglandis]|nr:hypothetical protein C1H21_15315 [Xanthomonas arboricola pv. juglandis]
MTACTFSDWCSDPETCSNGPDRSELIRPQSSEDRKACTACTMHTGHRDWSLPAHRRGTLRGMDAA